MKYKKLIELLKKCSNDPEKVEKLSLLADIVSSSEYHKLSESKSMNSIYIDSYTIDKLDSIDTNELRQRNEIIKQLIDFDTNFKRSILYGNAPEIIRNCIPNYTSLDNIRNINRKISISGAQMNYSNIDNDSFIDAFSDKTVSTASECIKLLPLSVAEKITITEDDLKNNIKDKLYCVDIEELKEAHREFIEYVENSETIIKKASLRRKRYRFVKASVVLMGIGLVFFFNQYGYITDYFTISFLIIYFIASLFYLIWG